MGVTKEDQESQKKNIPYPKSVFFIVSNELCERFSFYGMRAILSLYLIKILLYSEKDTKIIYHTYIFLAYIFTVFGAIISDSYLGKFKTIIYASVVYCIGNFIVSLASIESMGLPQRAFSILGLFLITIGTGGVKPCVSAFGGDQFILPQQAKQLASFFFMFYFSINLGSLISTFLTPVLRNDVHCFGKDSCFPLAFAVPGIMMVVSIVVFVLGKPLYKILPAADNIVLKVAKCIGFAVKEKIKNEKKLDHWLDYSEERYGKELVDDVKTTMKVLVLFTPLPIFWALFDQQGSGWTIQATRMNGDIGFYTILPDQMLVANPLLIMIFIPLFSYGIYPVLAKCNLLTRPLQRMTCGGFLAALSFVISAGVSMALENTYPVLPGPGNAQLRIYNPLGCNVMISSSVFKNDPWVLNSGEIFKTTLETKSHQTFNYSIEYCDEVVVKSGTFEIDEGTATGYYLTSNGFVGFQDQVDKSGDGLPLVRTLMGNPTEDVEITYRDNNETLTIPSNNTSLNKIQPGTYTLNGSTEKLKFELGGVYTVVIHLNATKIEKVTRHVVTKPNTVHILWLTPQYFVITAAEIMFSITGLEFSYSQAPHSMKSVLTAAFLITTAIGNLIVIIIESAKIFDKQSFDFFLYAGLMALTMVVFAFLASRYKYVEKREKSSEDVTDFAVEEKDANKALLNSQTDSTHM